jgi:UDP-glucose 4-epimerase
MNILVTGAAGFIGAHLSRALVAKGHRVVGLDDLSGGFAENIGKGVEFVEGSICDHALIEKLFDQHKFDYVYHLAAYAAEGLSHFIKRFNYNNNLIGSVNLINESVKHNIKCFVFTSSIAVYGEGQLPLREENQPIPEDSYGIAKLAVEAELRVTKDMFDLDYVVFRPHNVYGEYQNLGDRYRNVIGIFMNQIMQGNPLTVFGDGEQTRAFTYIDDLMAPMVDCIDTPAAYNEVFNIGADHPYSVNELISVVGNAMDAKPDLRYLDARNEVTHAYSDHSKVQAAFPNTSHTSLEDGIGRMAKWAKTAGQRCSSRFEDIEITRNLPQIWRE